ncbi:hypothetical protein G3I40_09710, partial [Streptomyces sp. SID14478]|uniref:hypothetical protein n=1 Tax=Streptomyces sp. SID14478 TaxID=2706073 RepID=UPI0013DD5514
VAVRLAEVVGAREAPRRSAVPAEPVSPRPALYLGAGALGGALFGAVPAFRRRPESRPRTPARPVMSYLAGEK